MSNIDKQHALDEFLQNYQHNDLIKAKVIIDYLAEIDPGERQRILFELSRLEDAFAIPILAYLNYKHPALIAENPQLKDQLLEKAIANPGLMLKNLVKLQPETEVYVDLVGKIRLREALPRLRQILTLTGEKALIEATIKTLGKMGDIKAIDAIGDYLLSDLPALQASAVQALGDIGTDKSLGLLFAVMTKTSALADVVLSIFKELETEPALQLLNRTLTLPKADLRTLGKVKLVEVGAKAIPILTENLGKTDPDLQIHTLNILMEIGDQRAVKAVRQLLTSDPEDDNVRFAAYEALAHLPAITGDYVLATGLTDRDDSIRLAAAKAIEKSLDPVLIGGIKNMIKLEDAESLRIIKAIVDAETADLFMGLLDVPLFSRIGVDYIATKVHKEVRRHYSELLQGRNRADLVAEIQRKSAALEKENDWPVICAVDDSVMILSIYRKILNELRCEPILFEFPEECLFWLSENKPAAVFTDLNMPKITGIELSKRIREQYSADLLPVIMVTTQKEGKDEEEIKRIGVTRLMSKPFDSETVRKTLIDLEIIT